MAQVKSFPGMPTTAAKLLKMLKDSESTAAQIEDVLRYDAGLTANILKLTNSAYFGIPSKVSSVRQAIMMLGWKRVMQLVMTMCMSTVMKKPIPGYDLPQGALWRHSVAVSVAAEAVVKALKIPEAEEVFTAALLHDVGKLVLGGFVKNDLEQIKTMAAKGIAFEVAENMIIGTDHAEIGAKVLKHWNFSSDVIEAVRWHHDPDSPEKVNIQTDIVYLANLLCQSTSTSEEIGGKSVELSPAVIERLGVQLNQFEAISGKIAQWVDELSDALAFN